MKVHTWADGFGNWHARVTEQGVGDAEAAQEAARTAIVDELTPREAPGWTAGRLVLVQISRTSQFGVLETEYVESWPTD